MAQSVQLGGGFTATGNVNIGDAIYAQRVEAGTIEVGPFDDGKIIARADEIIVEGDMDSTPVPCGASRQTVKRSELAGWAAYGPAASLCPHAQHFEVSM